MNSLVRVLLEELDRRERERDLIAAYDSLGSGPMTDVEQYLPAGTEVLRRG